MRVSLGRQPELVLGVAIAAGAWLRFAGLGTAEMSADEGSSWAAAAAPSIKEVLRRQAILNAGTLGAYDLALHSWIALAGDHLATMRALSAGLGTVAILIAFAVARAIAGPGPGAAACDLQDRNLQERSMIAAIAALLFAVNLAMVKYSREMRMYPLLMVATLAQVLFFLRASRRGAMRDCAGLSLFTALAVASNFTAALVPATEGLWLLCMLFRTWRQLDRRSALLRTSTAIAAGFALLVPMLPQLRLAAMLVNHGLLNWIKRPSILEPIYLLKENSGGRFTFLVMTALAAWGAWRGSVRKPEGIGFAILWLWMPMAALLVVSHVVTPMLIERYVLPSLAAFLVLIALGISELGEIRIQLAATAVIAGLSLGYVFHYERKPRDIQWREAAAAALDNLHGDAAVAIAPAYATNVVRYYTPPAQRGLIVPAVPGTPLANLLIVADDAGQPGHFSADSKPYTRIVAQMRGVEVWAR